MADIDYFANEAELPEGTLAQLFLETVDRFGDAPAFRAFVGDTDELRSISHREARALVRQVTGGLQALGIQRGDRVAILSDNRPEWALSDYGCICAGVPDVPIYATLLPSQVAYILEDSGAKLVFVSDREQMDKAVEAAGECSQDVRVVVYDDPGQLPEGVLSWERFLEMGRERMSEVPDEAFRAAALGCEPHDLATLIYTSGTTGSPKGVMLTHNNLYSNVRASAIALQVRDTDETLSFLPLCHVFQRMVDYLLFSAGCTITYAHDIHTAVDDMEKVGPTIVVSVPRLYEKVYNAVLGARGVKGVLLHWAREVAGAWADERLAGRRPTAVLRFVRGVADRVVLRKIRGRVGGRLRFFVSGGAPLEPEINRFFYSVGLTILEGYGLTETSPVTNVNTERDFRIGTVGKPVAGTEIRIAADGEILVRGPQVMKGYYGNPEATAEAIDPDGWFHTGDIGLLDRDGFLRITDRKKDLIVTAGGKNVAPQPIENRLKTNPYVEQIVMVGDRRKFCALLLVPDFGRLEAWATSNGISAASRAELVSDPRVQGLIQTEILGGLDDLAPYEMPKKVAVLTEEFTIANGALTPTQKVKRRIIEERFGNL
ncbi:MAG TPA: long-chain fatty acid--CoA ligase, partial [Longimicrobiales bacterium]